MVALVGARLGVAPRPEKYQRQNPIAPRWGADYLCLFVQSLLALSEGWFLAFAAAPAPQRGAIAIESDDGVINAPQRGAIIKSLSQGLTLSQTLTIHLLTHQPSRVALRNLFFVTTR